MFAQILHRSPGAIFFGWRVVAGSFVVAVFSWGIGFYGPPIYMETIHASRGWPIALISTAITVHFLLGALVVANLARLHRAFGLAAVTRAGAVATGLGLIGWAWAQEPWQLFAATLLSASGWATTSGAALNAMVSPWFVRRRPAALSMAFNGASMGGVVFSPLWVLLISRLGFQWAAIVVAASATGVLWVVASRLLTRTPAEMGLCADGDSGAEKSASLKGVTAAEALRSAWRDWRFRTLAATASLGLFAQIGLVTQLFSLLVPALGEAGAGGAMGFATASAIGGRALLGLFLHPQTDRRIAASANVGLQACGSLALILAAGHSIPLLLAGCFLFGLGLGNVTSLPPLVAQAEFQPQDVQRVVALVTAVSQGTYAFAPAAFGLLRHAEQAIGLGLAPGSAPLVFAAALTIQLCSAGAALLGRGAAARRTPFVVTES